MSKNKTLDSGLVPTYGTECIMYATGAGWAYGARTTAEAGVIYSDADGGTMPEPTDWQRCEDGCSGAELMKFCGPLQLAGMSDLISALTKEGVNVEDNGDGTGTITNPDGSTVTFVTTDADTTYTLTHASDVLTFTGSDGSVQNVTIVHPDDEDTALGDPVVNPATGEVTWPVLDVATGNTVGTRTGDFSAFLSSPHPTIAASGDATATFNAGTDTWTIDFVDTDTDQHMTVVTNSDGSQSLQLVDIDGNNIGTPVDLTPPPCPTTPPTDLCAVTLSGCEGGVKVAVPVTSVLPQETVCGVSTVEKIGFSVFTVSTLEPVTAGDILEYNSLDPETGLSYTVTIRVTSGTIQHLDLTGAGAQARFRPRSTVAEYTMHCRMDSYGSVQNYKCSTRPHLLTLSIKDLDATATDASTTEILNGTPTVRASSVYTQSGNLFTAVAPGNLSIDFEQLPDSVVDVRNTGYLNDSVGINLAVHHYEPVLVTMDCEGNFVSAVDSSGVDVIESEVNY